MSHQRYDFQWEVLEIFLKGKSAIDMNLGLLGFHIHTQDDAARFLDSYGYELSNPIEKAETLGNFHESLNFIRKYFLQPENPDGIKTDIPRKILEITEPRDLLLMAALHYPGQTGDSQGIALRDWACAILKVMHTITHADKDLRTPYFSDIQKQICDRFYKVVQRDAQGVLYLGEKPEDQLRVDLVQFETKPKKSRESILLKLLHKPENVAEELFDRVGIRFITKSRLGCLRVVKFLKDRMIVMPPNVKPSRSKNTLIDLAETRKVIETWLPRMDSKEADEKQLIEEVDKTPFPAETVNADNPHSRKAYRAIQFTSRQLIKLKNPLYDDLKELKALEKVGSLPESASKVVDRIDLKHIQREVRFFYPYEVQIMDEHSARENEQGQSSHVEYKRAQIQTAMKRVLGSLMDGTQ